MTTSTQSVVRPVFVSSRQALREDQVVRFGGGTASSIGTSLGDILSASYKAANLPAPESPKEVRTVKRSLDGNAIRWENPLFGSLEIDTCQLQLGGPITRGSNTCAQLFVQHRPSNVRIAFQTSAMEDVNVLYGKGNDVKDVTLVFAPVLDVKVQWKKDDWSRDLLPFTRVTDMDNVDFAFVNKQGMFVQLQISLITRRGDFFVCIQEIYSGQVVRTNHMKARELGVTTHHVGSHAGLIVPLYAAEAYPGADYLRAHKMGRKVVEYSIGWNSVIPLGEAVVARWSPPEFDLPAKAIDKEFVKAVVLWYNVLLGYGFVLLPDKRACYVHFDNLVDENGQPWTVRGDCPMLQPMKGIAVKFVEGPKNPKATAIIVL